MRQLFTVTTDLVLGFRVSVHVLGVGSISPSVYVPFWWGGTNGWPTVARRLLFHHRTAQAHSVRFTWSLLVLLPPWHSAGAFSTLQLTGIPGFGLWRVRITGMRHHAWLLCKLIFSLFLKVYFSQWIYIYILISFWEFCIMCFDCILCPPFPRSTLFSQPMSRLLFYCWDKAPWAKQLEGGRAGLVCVFSTAGRPRQPHCILLHGDMHFYSTYRFPAVNLKIVFSAYLFLNYFVLFFLFSFIFSSSWRFFFCDDAFWFLGSYLSFTLEDSLVRIWVLMRNPYVLFR